MKSLIRSTLFAMITALILLFTLYLPDRIVYTTAITSTSKEKLVEVPNVKGCSNFGTFCIVGSKAYALKTNAQDSKSVLYKIKDFSDPSKAKIVSKKTIKGLGHGNGMDYYDGKLWVATSKYPDESDAQVVALSLDGAVLDTYTADTKISSLTRYKQGQFLVGIGNNINDEYTVFKTAEIDETNKRLVFRDAFSVQGPSAEDYEWVIPQDIHYNASDKCLYAVYAMRRVTDRNCKDNNVFKIDLSDGIENGRLYSETKRFTIDTLSKKATLFEVESWATDGKINYCAINRKGSGDDGIFKISNEE